MQRCGEFRARPHVRGGRDQTAFVRHPTHRGVPEATGRDRRGRRASPLVVQRRPSEAARRRARGAMHDGRVRHRSRTIRSAHARVERGRRIERTRRVPWRIALLVSCECRAARALGGRSYDLPGDSEYRRRRTLPVTGERWERWPRYHRVTIRDQRLVAVHRSLRYRACWDRLARLCSVRDDTGKDDGHDAAVRQGRRRRSGSDGALPGHGCARAAERVGSMVRHDHPLHAADTYGRY